MIFLGMPFFDCLADGGHKIQMAVHDPQFKNWVTSVLAKYPNIDLDKVCFRACDKYGWAMHGTWYIEDRYTITYPRRMSQGIIEERDEAILFHELGHVHNHKQFPFLSNPYTNPKFLVKPMIALCSVLALMCMKNDIMQDAATAVIVPIPLLVLTTGAGIALGYALKNMYKRFDEYYADTFECQHVHKEALIKDYQWSKDCARTYESLYPNLLVRTLHKMRTDFAHPTYQDRAEKCAKYLHKRFNVRMT